MIVNLAVEGGDFNVLIAALGIAAKHLDNHPTLSRYGGGDNLRRVRKSLFDQLEQNTSRTQSSLGGAQT